MENVGLGSSNSIFEAGVWSPKIKNKKILNVYLIVSFTYYSRGFKAGNQLQYTSMIARVHSFDLDRNNVPHRKSISKR